MMSKANVLDHNWIDLVFEGRNQNYGAYQLRRDDSKNTMTAFFTAMGLLGVAVAIPMALSYLNIGTVTASVTPEIPPIVITPVDLPVFTQPKQNAVTPQKQVTPPAATPPQQRTIQYTTLVATNQPVENPPTMQQVQNTTIGQVTNNVPETNTLPVIAPPSTVPGGSGGNGGAGSDVYNVVDVMPTFPGGMKEFYSQVSRRFRTPETDAATYKVYVSFVVERDGTMTGIKVLRDPGMGMGAEAIRVLQSFKTKWTAGQKGGKPVRTMYNLPITVNVQ